MSDRHLPARMAAAITCAVIALATLALDAEDWPQWRGMDRDAVWRDTGLVERFADDGLIVKWRAPVRGGFAGPAVADGRVFVLDYQETPGSRTLDGHERLVVLDEASGAQLWTREWPATYRNINVKFATGPRATPTVNGDQVYILGAAGMLSCFETATGDLTWRVDTVADFGVTVPVFGVSQSPLVEGDHLIVVLGGEPDAMVVAFDTATGAEAWRAIETTSEPGYSSPIVITAGGVRQLIVWHAAAVTSVNPATGAIWWQHDFSVPSGLTIGSPVRSGRYLLVTQVENGGLMLALNPDRPEARLLWDGANPNRTDRPPQGATLSTPVVSGDTIYGLSSYGEFRGVDAATGTRLWSTDRLTPNERWANSYLVQNGDRWFVTNETGELIIARFTRAGYEEVDRTLLLKPTTRTRGGASGRWDDRAVLWAHPAFANRHVVARNDVEVVRLSLAAEDYE
ncbi:MAG: PQQ-binding-like beta-propeller repeat protein [Acidobacteriota bacterium]|nr:PQQ-binding-like beta-propeller repeat protein [Acidobacteriota bacterium]